MDETQGFANTLKSNHDHQNHGSYVECQES